VIPGLTHEIIQNWCKNNNIPGTVHHEPFKNFGYNRTLSLNLAKKMYTFDYALLLDADMELEINDTFNKNLLFEDYYKVEQYNRIINYYNIRLINVKNNWECIGVTHEYWNNTNITNVKLNTLKIKDFEDGGSKEYKYKRDIELLTSALNEPGDEGVLKSRYYFYLAKSYKDIKDYDTAIIFFEKRIAQQGWVEEVYYSIYSIGCCYEDKNETSMAIEKHLEAYNYRKSRAEALYSAVRVLRIIGKHLEAYKYALIGNKIKYPTNDILFIESSVYDYLFDYEITIVASYLPEFKNHGRETILKLLDRTDLPEWLTDNLKSNSKFYL